MSTDSLSPADLFDLKDKVAVIIGGTGELCGAMAEGLAAAGCKIMLVGRNEGKAKARLKALEAYTVEACFCQADVSQKGEIINVLDKTIQHFGKLDILINGAGVNSATPYLEIEEEEFDHLVTVNLKAVHIACQVFGEYFLKQGKGGSIINVGSMSGLLPLSRVFTYSATKAAVHNLSKNLAREWASEKIRVNTLVPGFFPAEQNRQVLTEERVKSIMGHTPMKRFGEARELVGATLLLASEAAGSFITGHELVVDGGYSAMTI